MQINIKFPIANDYDKARDVEASLKNYLASDEQIVIVFDTDGVYKAEITVPKQRLASLVVVLEGDGFFGG